MSTSSQRDSVIRVALAVMNREGWSVEHGKNSAGFVLIKGGERLVMVGHGRWDLNQDERDQLYGRLLKLYSRNPEASRGVVILPVSASDYVDEVSQDVRIALGIEVAIVDPAAGTMEWQDDASQPDVIDLDNNRRRTSGTGGVVARLRRIFK